jgi:acyl dehydratase
MDIDMNIVGESLGTILRKWDADDAILYALGVGAGAVPGGTELAYTTENSDGVPQRVLPSYAAVLGFPLLGFLGDAGLGSASIFGRFPPSAILHADQELTVHGILPAAGTARVTAVVAGVHDTGEHVLITVATQLTDAGNESVLADSRATFLVRGTGGFGGPRPEPDGWHLPRRAPDHVLDYATMPAQGLLYRLSGDRNRLHSDPVAAREAGYDRPILHGLCTFGFAGRALLHAACGGNPARFGSMSARFTSPVMPGDALTVRLWDDGGPVKFQVLVGDRVVMDRGRFSLSTPNSKGDGND